MTLETGLSEVEERMRQIAREIVDERADMLRKEIMEGELGRLRLELDALFRRVWEAIEALAEAQRRTEERVNELAEAQRRTEERVNELAEAQRRTEERLERLEATVQALAEAQRRTEERVSELAEAQRRTEERVNELAEAQRRTEQVVARLTQQMGEMSKQVGQLANRLGLDLEVDAEEVLRDVLEKKGFRLLREPFSVIVDGEADIVALVESSEGLRFSVLVEVKGRVRRKELGDWLQRLADASFRARLQQEGVGKPYLPYLFGLRLYGGVEEMASESGIGLLDWRGERVPPRAWESWE